jgi:hypothetical protein
MRLDRLRWRVKATVGFDLVRELLRQLLVDLPINDLSRLLSASQLHARGNGNNILGRSRETP